MASFDLAFFLKTHYFVCSLWLFLFILLIVVKNFKRKIIEFKKYFFENYNQNVEIVTNFGYLLDENENISQITHVRSSNQIFQRDIDNTTCCNMS